MSTSEEKKTIEIDGKPSPIQKRVLNRAQILAALNLMSYNNDDEEEESTDDDMPTLEDSRTVDVQD